MTTNPQRHTLQTLTPPKILRGIFMPGVAVIVGPTKVGGSRQRAGRSFIHSLSTRQHTPTADYVIPSMHIHLNLVNQTYAY